MSERSRILAVDDDPLNLDILGEVLGEDFDLTTAETGEAALSLAEEIKPDLVLLDIMMPGLDGYETCSRMRANPSLKFSKIILLSAKAMVAERLRGYEVGADDYVTKPFDHAELLAKVRVFLRLKSVEEMDALKTEFLTLVAHETRTPLTQLLAGAELLAGDTPLGEERTTIAGIIQDASERLHGLLERGLHYCALRAGGVAFFNTRFDAQNVLRETAAMLESRRRRLDATLDIATSQTAEMASDWKHVQLVMQLLIESALERGGRGSRVTVRLSANEASVVVAASCPGQGLERASLHLLLEPIRSPDVSHHASGGVIALPLAAEVMKHLGGELTIDLDENQALTLRATFPRVADAANLGLEGTDEGWKRAA